MNYSKTAKFFKKSVRSAEQPLNMLKGRVFEYSDAHIPQVSVRYGDENEQWINLRLTKREQHQIFQQYFTTSTEAIKNI